MRVTGGTARGKTIAGPRGMAVRPTSSKVRQAIFNILGTKVAGSRFLDIFAGSGLIGIEALSRGATSLVLIEENKRIARAIEETLSLLGMNGRVYASDFRKVLPKLLPGEFDIVFADPPYRTSLGQVVLAQVAEFSLLAACGVFLLEHTAQYDVPEQEGNLHRYDRRQYGDTVIAFYQRRSSP